jgi:hypothetical protein
MFAGVQQYIILASIQGRRRMQCHSIFPTITGTFDGAPN